DATLDSRSRRPLGRLAHPERRVLLPDDVARVVLVDVELAVEAQVLRIRAEKALDVGLGREEVELLVLERAQVLPANLGRLLDLGEIEPLTQARLSQTGSDFEQGGRPIVGVL